MAFETVAIPLDENWTLVSNASTGPLEASFDNGEALFFFGDVAPAGGTLGISRSDLCLTALATKVWARGTAGSPGLLTVYRTVNAGNPEIYEFKALTLSATTVSEASLFGTVVATILHKTPGSIVEITPNDGRFFISRDGTQILRGHAPLSAGSFDIQLTEIDPKTGLGIAE